MLQSGEFIEILGYILIALGVIVVIVGFLLMTKASHPEDQTIRKESKGVILVGPIPIIWGFGKKVWGVAVIVCILLFAIWFLFFI